MLQWVALTSVAVNTDILDMGRYCHNQYFRGERLWCPILKARHYPTFLLFNCSSDNLLDLLTLHALKHHSQSYATLIWTRYKGGAYKGTRSGLEVPLSVRYYSVGQTAWAAARRSFWFNKSSRAAIKAWVRIISRETSLSGGAWPEDAICDCVGRWPTYLGLWCARGCNFSIGTSAQGWCAKERRPMSDVRRGHEGGRCQVLLESLEWIPFGNLHVVCLFFCVSGRHGCIAPVPIDAARC